jgi:hypothetical protein
MVEAREAQSKAIVENVEQEWVTVNERVVAGVSHRSVGWTGGAMFGELCVPVRRWAAMAILPNHHPWPSDRG